jgi:transposase
VSKPQVIDDAPHERVYERVAAIDVAKKEGVVCLRLPHPAQPQGRRSVVWTVLATTGAVTELAGRLLAEGVQKVTLESTSDYWRIWFYLLEAAGLDVQLVNASQVRQVQGRPKTDKLDAMWLARLTETGLLRPSFVPPAEIRALRGYARARTRLTQDRTRCWARLEKLLEDALLTELRRGIAVSGSRAGAGVATVPVRDHRRGRGAGSVVAGGAAARCA